MRKIDGEAKTVGALLGGGRFSIDYYQREYRWQKQQLQELLDDLTGRFLDDHEPSHARTQVGDYGHYFLGSVIVSQRDGSKYIVDGQQRLTTLTLLLIFLNNLQRDRDEKVEIGKLIFSEKYGKKAFNIDVEERAACMDSLFKGEDFDAEGASDAVANMTARYEEMDELFPEQLRGPSLPYFIDWLTENVHLVEISTLSDEDAYTIFETMNDRGLRLSPIDMLKGYLLANIKDPQKRGKANDLWKGRVQELADAGRDVDADCFKSWLRARHAKTIRDRGESGAGDYDRIGAEFHRWVRDSAEDLGLASRDDFVTFIGRDFDFYAKQYLRIIDAGRQYRAELPEVFYNAQANFTLQPMILLAVTVPGEKQPEIDRKMRLAATAIDILLHRRIWSFRSIAQRDVKYLAFDLAKRVRDLEPVALAAALRTQLDATVSDADPFEGWGKFGLHGMNRKHVHRMLARLTEYVEVGAGLPSRYAAFTTGTGKAKYEVEHVWANKFARHRDEFDTEYEFREQRNRLGGLLLLPKTFNSSYGDMTYEKKLPHYHKENLLAASLHQLSYDNNPGFLSMIEKANLPFTPHADFRVADLNARHDLYRQLAERVWDPARLDRLVVTST